MTVDGRYVDQARRDLTALLAAHPELMVEDQEGTLRLDMIEGSTSVLGNSYKLLQAERDTLVLESGIELEFERLRKRLERFVLRRQPFANTSCS